MNAESILPKGWVKHRLADLVTPRRERVPPTEFPDLPFIGMDHVEAQSMKLLGTVLAGQMKSSAARFYCGDVLYGRLRPYLNKVIRPEFDGLASAEFIVMPNSNHLISAFLQYRLNSIDFVSYASHLNEGDRPRVNFVQIGDFGIDLPPANEQKRIVAKIEELFSNLDAGVASLERVKENLKRYRASVLKAAVEGRLTDEWRKSNPPKEPASRLLERILTERRKKWEEEQLAKYEAKGKEPPKGWKDKYKEPVTPDTSNLPELPEGWCWVSLSQIGFLDRGRSKHRPRNASHLFGGPYPFLQTGDVKHSDTYIREYTQTYSEAGLLQSKLWQKGTLCITIAANIADTAILSFEGCFPDSVVGWLPASQDILVQFVELYFRTIQSRIEAFAPATAQKNINLQVLQHIAVPLPPLNEQVEIVSEMDRRLSITNQVEQATNINTSYSMVLRQAILKRAFEGKLVPQNPNDEPASILLKRIRSEQEVKAGKFYKTSSRPRRKVKGMKKL